MASSQIDKHHSPPVAVSPSMEELGHPNTAQNHARSSSAASSHRSVAACPSYDGETDHRMEVFQRELSTLQGLWTAEQAGHAVGEEDAGRVHRLEKMLESIGDAARNPAERLPIGESGVLDCILALLKSKWDFHNSTLRLILRCVGNSYENRARVLAADALPSIIAQLHVPDLVPLALPVLYNICLDYVPAQQQASQDNLSRELVELVGHMRADDQSALIEYIHKILDLLITQPVEVDLAPANTPLILMESALSREHPPDLEDFIALLNTALSYLQHARFQTALITSPLGVETCLSVHLAASTRTSPSSDEAKQLSALRTTLTHLLSDISALPLFSVTFSPVSSLITTLISHLSVDDLISTTVCIVLGNLARSDDACLAFVDGPKIHVPLTKALRQARSAQALHACLGCLKNLALPKENKAMVGKMDDLWRALEHLWQKKEDEAVVLSAVSLARQLCVGCLDNNVQILSLASECQAPDETSTTRLNILMAVFAGTDTEPIKLEISRLVAAVCKNVCTREQDKPDETDRSSEPLFNQASKIAQVLGHMIVQTKWKGVRSEGWSVLALMTTDARGAKVVEEALRPNDEMEALRATITGRATGATTPSAGDTEELNATITQTSLDNVPSTSSSSSQEVIKPTQLDSPAPPPRLTPASADMEHVDRQNAMVLLTELLKRRDDVIPLERRHVLEDLAREGSLVMSRERDLTSVPRIEAE